MGYDTVAPFGDDQAQATRLLKCNACSVLLVPLCKILTGEFLLGVQAR